MVGLCVMSGDTDIFACLQMMLSFDNRFLFSPTVHGGTFDLMYNSSCATIFDLPDFHLASNARQNLVFHSIEFEVGFV